MDHDVVLASINLLEEVKSEKGIGKYLLKNWLSETWSFDNVFRKKQGFKFSVNDYKDEIKNIISSEKASKTAKLIGIDIHRIRKEVFGIKGEVTPIAYNFVMVLLWMEKNEKSFIL